MTAYNIRNLCQHCFQTWPSLQVIEHLPIKLRRPILWSNSLCIIKFKYQKNQAYIYFLSDKNPQKIIMSLLKYYRVACLSLSHYLNKSWLLMYCTIRNKLLFNVNDIRSRICIWKCHQLCLWPIMLPKHIQINQTDRAHIHITKRLHHLSPLYCVMIRLSNA